MEVQKLHSRSACRLLPHEDIIYAYMQELNAVVLYVVIFGPSQFWLASVLLIPVLVRHTARNQCMIRRPGCENFIFCKYGWSNCTISYDLQQMGLGEKTASHNGYLSIPDLQWWFRIILVILLAILLLKKTSK